MDTKRLITMWLHLVLVFAARGDGTNAWVVYVSRGLEGQSPVFTYEVRPADGTKIDCKLMRDGNLVTSRTIAWTGDTATLPKALVRDFAFDPAKIRSQSPAFGGGRWDLNLRVVQSNIEQKVNIIADAQLISDFIANTQTTRALFGAISNGNAKMFRLFDEPGRWKEMGPPNNK